MRFLRQLVLVAALALLVGMGCASVNLSGKATPEEKRAALCMDATSMLAMANVALAAVKPDIEHKRYWEAARVSAEMGVVAYCQPVTK